MIKPYQAVVIGVSAGGLEALSILLKNIISSFSLPIIIVQHIHEQASGMLPEILNRVAHHPVLESNEKDPIEPGTIYIAPPGYHLLIEQDYTFSLSAEPPIHFSRPSIDLLFDTASDVYGAHLIGIILTGANSDGTSGLKKIKEYGGLTIVQEPSSAKVDAMPRAAIAAVDVDYILELTEIAALLSNLTQEKRYVR